MAKCSYCEKETFQYCEDCSRPICKDHYQELKYDDALDADDGYGDYWSIYICKKNVCEWGVVFE